MGERFLFLLYILKNLSWHNKNWGVQKNLGGAAPNARRDYGPVM